MVRSCGYCVAVWVLCGWADGVVAAVFILTVVVSCVIVHCGCCHHGGGGGGVRSLWLCGCCHCCLLVAGILAASPQPEEEACCGEGWLLDTRPSPISWHRAAPRQAEGPGRERESSPGERRLDAPASPAPHPPLRLWVMPSTPMQATHPELGEVQALESLKVLLCAAPPLFLRVLSCAETHYLHHQKQTSPHPPALRVSSKPGRQSRRPWGGEGGRKQANICRMEHMGRHVSPQITAEGPARRPA